ncbi:MAG TPA: DUF2844 domain-containing protein [Nitrospiria bacterium]|jgi:hypothetical protein|nr:DUF2844 domain-containing protein [Nitrospiria bacterium]
MKLRYLALFVGLSLWMTMRVSGSPVQAALGESDDSITSDEKALSAVRGAPAVRNGYTVHEIRSDSTAVREYVSPTGIVFGIAWNGRVHPDLTPLLGSYAGEYHEALRRSPREPGRRPYYAIKTDRVVVEKWGHMRNFQGRAYAPALIPPGVSIDEIK